MLTQDHEILENKERFVRWYRSSSNSANESYINHAIDILSFWLEDKIPNNDVGCLFRYDSLEEYDQKLQEIFLLPAFATVNLTDSNGRPKAALNRYRKYVMALEDHQVDDVIENMITQQGTSHQPIRNRRRPPLNCMDGFIDLLVGDNAANITDDSERFKILAQHMISKTFFFKPETVNARHELLLSYFRVNAKIPVRMSTKKDVYQEEDGTPINFTKSTLANEISLDRNIFMDCFGKRVRVLIDRDGNAMVRRLIENKTGVRVSQGTLRNDIKSAIISHIWGDAYNPICFSNLWNLAVVPDYLNPIMDKTENPRSADYFDRAICYVKGYYKQFVYQLYSMDKKIADYEALGINIRPLFENVFNVEIDDAVNAKSLMYLEDLGFNT